jgi:hypothetical protein
VQYESREAQLLPPVNAEVPQIWNGWYINRSIDAFKRAVAEDKPFVLVFGIENCIYCMRFVTDSLRCPSVDRFAGEAIFAFSYFSQDRGANAIGISLDIDAAPTISVLEPESRMLLERGRINGYFSGVTLGQHLETILWKTKPRVYVESNGVAEPPSPIDVLGTWNSHPSSAESIAKATSGAAKRGLKHTPPEVSVSATYPEPASGIAQRLV